MEAIITDIDELINEELNASHLDKGVYICLAGGGKRNAKSNMVAYLPRSLNKMWAMGDDSGVKGSVYKKYLEYVKSIDSRKIWPQIKKRNSWYRFRGGENSDAHKLLTDINNSDKLIQCWIDCIDENKIYRHDYDNYEIAEKLYNCACEISSDLADGFSEIKVFRNGKSSKLTVEDIDKIKNGEYEIENQYVESNIIYERKIMKHIFEEGNAYKRTGMSEFIAEIFLKSRRSHSFFEIFDELKKEAKFSYLNKDDKNHIKRVKDALGTKVVKEFATYDNSKDNYKYRSQSVKSYMNGTRNIINKYAEKIIDKYKNSSDMLSVSDYVDVGVDENKNCTIAINKMLTEHTRITVVITDSTGTVYF